MGQISRFAKSGFYNVGFNILDPEREHGRRPALPARNTGKFFTFILTGAAWLTVF
jgi:hypothetical protein